MVAQAAEREMAAARRRAVEMIAVAEAVGAQRVAASVASVNKMFDEQHPDLAAAHPAFGGPISPAPGTGRSPAQHDFLKSPGSSSRAH